MEIKSEKVKEFHATYSKLSSEELLAVFMNLKMMGPMPDDLIKIMKTYMVRALIREGFQ